MATFQATSFSSRHLGVRSAPLPRGYLRAPPKKRPAWQGASSDLYGCLSATQLEAPTLCAEWLPWNAAFDDGSTARQLLLGTDAGRELVPGNAAMPRVAAREDRDFLLVVRVELPEDSGRMEEHDACEVKPGVQITRRIDHAGPVCALSHCPFNPDLVATGSVLGDVSIFDLQGTRSKLGRSEAAASLVHHEGCCRGVTWSPHQDGMLLSTALDGQLCIWDLTEKRRGALALSPLRTLRRPHSGQRVSRGLFHPGSMSLIASAGADGCVRIWDTRAPWTGDTSDKPVASVLAHTGGCWSMDFSTDCLANPMLATGGQDEAVRLWDLRRFDVSLQTFNGHRGPVTRVSWSSFASATDTRALSDTCYLASAASGRDNRVLIWDPRHSIPPLTRSCTSEAFAQELVFIHDAHTDAIMDLSWAPVDASPSSPLIASIDAAGKLQLWRIAADALHEDAHRLLR